MSAGEFNGSARRAKTRTFAELQDVKNVNCLMLDLPIRTVLKTLLVYSSSAFRVEKFHICRYARRSIEYIFVNQRRVMKEKKLYEMEFQVVIFHDWW